MTFGNYRDLIAWQRAMDLVLRVYLMTEHFPASERYGLTSQMRRAAVSVISNIAEGNYRSSRGDYLHMLSIARGSLGELTAQVELANRLRMTTEKDAEEVLALCDRVGRLLTRLRAALAKNRDLRSGA